MIGVFNKNRLVITSIISILVVMILFMGSTYSLFSASNIDEDIHVYKTGNLDITYELNDENMVLSDSNPTSIEDSVYMKPYRIKINNIGDVAYKFDLILNEDTAINSIDHQYIMTQVGRFDPVKFSDCDSGIIKEDIIIPVNDSVVIDIRVWLSDNISNTEIGKSFYAKLSIDGIAVHNDNNNIDNSKLRADIEANKPNLGDGLIPVYYDYDARGWKKADSNNSDNSWYNYDDKTWANAILVSDETKRATYLSADVGTSITISDVTAFYVWIPRYKYRVWNINRQAGGEDTYAYSAFTTGIDIKFEEGTSTTGNVECSYNSSTVQSATNLSDRCVYKTSDVITTTSDNTKYKNAWYTHPSFTFNGKELTGFWMGKFETSGTTTAPRVIPNAHTLVNQTVSTFFTTSRKFQDYGLSSDMTSHLATNLQWGAMTYLTHSIYGLCDGSSCRDTYINNSKTESNIYYTGRSGGAEAGSNDLILSNVYGSSVTTSTAKYSGNGYYFYSGRFINYDGSSSDIVDMSKIASNNGNVSGIYDVVGGAYDYVMGNMVNSSGAFYPSGSGTSWNGSSSLNGMYYNSYSYGTDGYSQSSFNRARLGDATAESTFITGSSAGGWKPNSSLKGFTTFANGTGSWMIRGDEATYGSGSIFAFQFLDGNAYTSAGFRVAIS